jgi:hypothetical protein
VKPGDFLLGVLDFFGILLPGSLATWLVTQYIPPKTLREALSFGLGDGTANPDPLLLGAAFVLSSYLLGHFVFMAGAKLDLPYDRWRKRAKPKNRDMAFREAEKVQTKLTPGLAGGDFTTLKWAKAYVQVKAPAARVEIDRLEADSKFFRSLVVVWALAAAHFLLREQSPVAGVVALALTGLSYLRFREQRWKMTELSYGTAVIVDATTPPSGGATASRAADGAGWTRDEAS